MCDTAVETTAGGLTTGWWAVVWECFSSHPLAPRPLGGIRVRVHDDNGLTLSLIGINPIMISIPPIDTSG